MNQFLSSSLVTSQMLPFSSFQQHIDMSLRENEQRATAILTRLLFLLQSTIHANGIVTRYGTNFEYFDLWSDESFSALYSKAIAHENNCSCDLNKTCTMQASFIQNFTRVSVPGLKMGCLPSDAFLASTLECLYNASCIDLIIAMASMNSNHHSIHDTPVRPLDTNGSRFLPTTTVADLVDNLFIETWSTTLSCPSYFARCSPLSCQYTYTQQFNSVYTITYLFSLYGGLSLGLKWICPRATYILMKLFFWYKIRRNMIDPVDTDRVTSH